MTRRSFQNDRNTGDGPEGVTKKSAAKAKPAREAASTVYLAGTKKKSRRELRAEAEEAARKKQAKAASKVGTSKGSTARETIEVKKKKNPEIKKWRRIWWTSLVVGVLSIVLAYLFTANGYTDIYLVFIVLAYAAIIFALYIEFGKIRVIRKRETQQAASKKTPKMLKHEQEARRLEEARRAEKKSKSVFNSLRRNKSKEEPRNDLPFKEE